MTGKKIVSHKELRVFIEEKLLEDQSPEEISKRITRHEKHLPTVSAKAIREFIASPYGRRIEARRNVVFKKKRKNRSIRKKIQGKRMISKRPKKINLRRGLGHSEMDFIVSGRSGKGILLVIVDRKTRKKFFERILPVSVVNVMKGLQRIKKRYPELQTLTTDNDILFLEHTRIEKVLKIKIYFCHPHSPWEKGSVENVNKKIRRYVPKSSDISKYSPSFFRKLEEKFNNHYMDILGSLTPNEMHMKEKKRQKKTPK